MNTKRKKVLVVDDEAAIAELIAEFCELLGYETMVLNGGTEVMNVVESYRPDLITLDLVMPDLHGTHVLKTLKSNDGTKSIPVVVISSASDQYSETCGLSEGVLDKPLHMRTLKEKIEKIFLDRKELLH